MDEAKIIELANRILEYDKKDTRFFDFMTEQFPDNNSIVSFLEQIDLILENDYNQDLADVKYILVALIEDNRVRNGYISQLENLPEEEQIKVLENLPSDYFKRQIIVSMTNRLQYIDKIQSVKTRTRIIGRLNIEEINSYMKQKTQEERDAIVKNLPDRLKISCIEQGIVSEEETKNIIIGLKDINSILELKPEHLRVWREYGDINLITENIDVLMQKEGIVNEEERKNRKEILSRMYQKNDRCYNTINFELLDERYISILGEDKINQFSIFQKQQEMLLRLGKRKDISLNVFAKCIEKHTTWRQLADVLLTCLDSLEYDDLLKNIKSLDNIDIGKLSSILQHSNVFEITTQEDIINFDSIKEKKCNEWIKSNDISRKKLAVLEKIFGQDLNDTHEILRKYSTDIDAISDEDLKAYVKSLQVIYNSNDSTLIERIYKEVKEIELINPIGIENGLKIEYCKLLNEGLLKVDGNLTQLSELGSNVYDAGTDFKIIMTSIGAFVNNRKEREDYCKDWNRADIGCQHVCTSYIRNDMIGTAPINNICYGFSSMAESSLIMEGAGDIISTDKRFSSKALGEEKYFSPDNLINNTQEYNELDFNRYQEGKKKQPDYILVFKRNGQIPNLDEARRAQLDWGGKLPIVVVDVEKCLEEEKSNIELLKKQYIENPSKDIEKYIRQRVRNNRVTFSNFCPEIESFFEKHQNKTKTEPKKNVRFPVKNIAKCAYRKVKQKTTELIGMITMKHAYESTTTNERAEEMSRFKQIFSQVQEITRGEESNGR